MATDQNQPLTDDEIAAMLDDTASDLLRSRVENSAAYQQQVEDERIAAQLGGILYRFDCPSTQALADYHLGMTDPVSEKNVERHIHICASCQNDISALEDFLNSIGGQESGVRETATIRPQSIVATIHIPQATIRGSAVRGLPRSLAAQAGDDLTIMLQIAEDKSGVQLQGQLAPTSENKVNWVSAIVELRMGGNTEPYLTTIDDVLQFRFQQIRAAVVNVRLISTEGNIVRIENINLTEN